MESSSRKKRSPTPRAVADLRDNGPVFQGGSNCRAAKHTDASHPRKSLCFHVAKFYPTFNAITLMGLVLPPHYTKSGYVPAPSHCNGESMGAVDGGSRCSDS